MTKKLVQRTIKQDISYFSHEQFAECFEKMKQSIPLGSYISSEITYDDNYEGGFDINLVVRYQTEQTPEEEAVEKQRLESQLEYKRKMLEQLKKELGE